MMAWSKRCTAGLLRFWLCGLACLLLGGGAGASNWYAAPSGTSSGSGSIASPWDLDTAETEPLQPGDTLWLRGGTYESSSTGGYNFVFNGSATAPIIIRNYNNERVTIDGTAREFSLSVNGSYIWVWGLEFEDLHPNGRTVSVPGSGNQDQIQLGYGPSIYGPNNKFINCIVHNTAQGFSGYAAAPNLEVYGSLSYYNGYIAPDRNHGHGVYMQNTTGTKLIADNIVGDNADEGIQVYGNSGPLIGITLQGNTAYNTWSWPTPNYQANIIMGGGGAVYGNSILQNMSFFTLSQQYGSIDIGQYTGSYDIDVEQNVFVGGLDTVAVEGVNSPFTFVKNTMVNLPTGYNSTVQEQIVFGQYSDQNTSGYTWDNNAYYGTNLFYGGVYNGTSLANGSTEPFSVWSTSAFDNHSTFTPALPTGKWIYVRPNKYETKRANITVYNWDAYNASGNVVLGKSPSVQVDLSSVLAVGDQFVIQDAQNFFGPAVVSGTYAGGTVTIPMEGLAKELPIGFATPAHTAPGFGTFIVMVPGAGNASSGSTSPGTPTPTVPAPSPAVCPCTIWSSGALPANIDSGSGPGVELGVKFRSDSSGTITGLRFYKSAGNTGTHIGNLWSSSGTLLATATFTSETASGWQQVSFSSPVAITANTVYVASYHTNVGHFSYNLNAFASAGVDNSPLHALQNGVSGGNGVYMYGGTSAFPSNTYNSANYWVDVVFSTTTAASTPTSSPTLVSIAVTPTNPSVNAGATQQFVATGTYQDASTQNLSTQVTWSSSNTTVAAISSAGLATGQSAGSSNITAALNGITSSGVSLSVQAAPAPAASLVSVTVSPSSATVQPGTVQQFTATGYYSNGNTQDLTNSVNWNSSSTSVATLNGSGLASVQGPGSTVISASISGSATIIGQASVSSGTSSSTLPSGLLLHWTFDSTSISGNTLTDSSPNNQTGTIHGNAVSVAGVLGQALQFDGSSNYVTTLTGAPFTGSITLAAWIKTTNQSRPEAIISRYDAAGSGTGYIFRTDAAGHLEVVFGGANGGSINSPAVDTAVINDGQWHHALAVITVGQGVQFYVDGKPTAYVPQSFWAADASGYFYVGLNSFTYFGNFFTGSIDEVQAYNRALSPSEANTVYLLSGGH
jgi:hypothetical protein